MSYRKKKFKKSNLNRWYFQSQLAWDWFFSKFFSKLRKILKKRGGWDMRFPTTIKVMTFLREQNRLIRKNNLKINEWVDDYLNWCIANGEPVTILTQWCISKDLETRFREQGKKFTPTRKERMVFEKEVPAIATVLSSNGVRFNWWITFNRSYLDSGRIGGKLDAEYKEMVTALAQPLVERGWLLLADWEDEVLGKRPGPNTEVLESVERFVTPTALKIEVERHSAWAREEAGLRQSAETLRRDVYLQIACEADEGRLLASKESPLGEFIMIPLEVPERYDFFTILIPDFKKRIVAVLNPYPWRLKKTA